MSAKPEVELIFTIVHMENSSNVIKTAIDTTMGSVEVEYEIILAIDWHHDLRPWMTLNCPRSKSQNLHIKYIECHERYNV